MEGAMNNTDKGTGTAGGRVDKETQKAKATPAAGNDNPPQTAGHEHAEIKPSAPGETGTTPGTNW